MPGSGRRQRGLWDPSLLPVNRGEPYKVPRVDGKPRRPPRKPRARLG